MGNLQNEKKTFDKQTQDRIANGHIPDLRRVVDCDYFYNNTWRRKAYVKLDMQEQFELIRDYINVCFPGSIPVSVLEIGCGPGYLSLELARAGFHVTGIDLSDSAIEVAQTYADQDPWKSTRGSLTYISGDIMTYEPEGLFDAVIFVGALHHFKDQDSVLAKAGALLKADGIILAHEPTRDRVSHKNAAVSTLIEVLASAGGAFYTNAKVPDTESELKERVEKKYLELKYEGEIGDKLQSPNDNDAGYIEMMGALQKHFDQIHFEDRYGLFHEIIGGLRFDESSNERLARFIHDMDRYLCQAGAIDATEFFYIGRKTKCL